LCNNCLTQERKMFEQPEADKMAFCERHRLLGNFLFGAGVLPKAAEQYKTVSAPDCLSGSLAVWLAACLHDACLSACMLIAPSSS
jgi:hypothetical protein